MNKVNDVTDDPGIETPCPLCGGIGIYKKFLRFDLLDHLKKLHDRKELASFVCREAHFSRFWDMDEETCKRKHFDRTRDLYISVLQDWIESLRQDRTS